MEAGVSKEVPKVNELIKPRTQDTQDRDLCKKRRPGHRHTQRDGPVRRRWPSARPEERPQEDQPRSHLGLGSSL